MTTSRHRGARQHRRVDNPLEDKLAQMWEQENERAQILQYILGDGNRRAPVSDRDCLVAATAVQWLGSPVGKACLEHVGLKLVSSEENV